MWVLNKGLVSGRNAINAGVSSSYTGPGDSVSGASLWFSPARAYSAAFAAGGTGVMDLVDQAGANPITINILSTGFVNVSAITSWVATNSVTTINVTKLYDQTGNGFHATQVTLANMPTLVLSAVNGLPALEGGASLLLNTATITQAQPFSVHTVYNRVSGTTFGAAVGAGSGTLLFIGGDTVANQARISNASAIQIAGVADAAWHSAGAVFNGASGAYNIDGTDVTAQNFGANGFAGNAFRILADGVGSHHFIGGRFVEGGLWPTAFTLQNRSDLNSSAHSPTAGYNF